jgi:peptide-methionine (S)-S-oxide reductase
MTEFVLGGGCFWCLDAVFRRIKGVAQVESGYAGGTTASPTYAQVSTGTTGHAEVVRVQFDESVVPADIILDIFFLIHDPTTLDRQGADVGPQYRSIMLFKNKEQKVWFEAAKLRATTYWEAAIVTEIVPLDAFHPAESEHQDYFNKNPDAGYCQIVIAPKVLKTKQAYKKWFKEDV